MTVMQHKTDYLIVGAGAVGMAFADVLLTETDADIIIIDSHHKPGGHWNVAYPFVTLHQPSTFYGVSSKELGRGEKDEVGLNKGLADLASGAEVCAYFDHVMKHTFLPSGRVRFFPMCDYQGEGRFVNRLSGAEHRVSYDKIVDCTYLKTSVPSTHTPNFEIAAGATFMPLNDLVHITSAPAGFVVIGGGKTGIDACLWLLEMGVNPDDVTWIVSRDAWLIDRENTQPSDEFFFTTMEAQAVQMESIAAADSIDDMFDKLEAGGYFLRLDPDVRPSMFHGATISRAELDALRTIKNVVRKGRVTRVGTDTIELVYGSIPTSLDHVHVDCSATAISNLDMLPVFQGDLIVPQTVRSYQPVFSAAFIAHIEARGDSEAEKNRLCQVVPLPNHDTDYLRFTAAFMMNQFNWSRDKDLRAWLLANRLDGFSQMAKSVTEDEPDKMAVMMRLRQNAMPAMMKLRQFIDGIEAETSAA